MESTTDYFLSGEEISQKVAAKQHLNPIDHFLKEHSPMVGEKFFRERLFELVKYVEGKTIEDVRINDRISAVSSFISFLKKSDINIPSKVIDSYFGV